MMESFLFHLHLLFCKSDKILVFLVILYACQRYSQEFWEPWMELTKNATEMFMCMETASLNSQQNMAKTEFLESKKNRLGETQETK